MEIDGRQRDRIRNQIRAHIPAVTALLTAVSLALVFGPAAGLFEPRGDRLSSRMTAGDGGIDDGARQCLALGLSRPHREAVGAVEFDLGRRNDHLSEIKRAVLHRVTDPLHQQLRTGFLTDRYRRFRCQHLVCGIGQRTPIAGGDQFEPVCSVAWVVHLSGTTTLEQPIKRSVGTLYPVQTVTGVSLTSVSEYVLVRTAGRGWGAIPYYRIPS